MVAGRSKETGVEEVRSQNDGGFAGFLGCGAGSAPGVGQVGRKSQK
jgi:hypothetical protein